MNNFCLALYASSPAWNVWNADDERTYYEKMLVENLDYGMLELPFCGSFHPHDDAWFFNNFPQDKKLIFTTIPGVMNRLSRDPDFGLASCSPEGRKNAIHSVRQLYECVKKINRISPDNGVIAVELHSAPNRLFSSASSECLYSSLNEICGWDWGEVDVMLEHCDAFVGGGRIPSKGFLDIEDEIEVLNELNKTSMNKVSMILNWARSAIEGRSVLSVYSHIRKVSSVGLLKGFYFSGVSSSPGYYGEWLDTHMPNAPSENFPFGRVGSLLTLEEINNTAKLLSGVAELDFVGVKIASELEASIKERSILSINLLNMVRQSFQDK